jgi:hypothetical protein
MRDAWRNVVMRLAGERFAICLLPAVFPARQCSAVGLGVAGAPMLMKGINLER